MPAAARQALENLGKGEAFILICPERIGECVGSTGAPLHLAFDKVLYHELGHAFMDTAPAPDEGWGRALEESLANLWALSHFTSSTERAWVLRIIGESLPEYRGQSFSGTQGSGTTFCKRDTRLTPSHPPG